MAIQLEVDRVVQMKIQNFCCSVIVQIYNIFKALDLETESTMSIIRVM